MKKLYDWLKVWDKYTTTDKERHNKQEESSDDTSGGKRRRLKIPDRKPNTPCHRTSDEDGINISDVQLFDNNREI